MSSETLYDRIGQDTAQRLFAIRNAEEREEELGLREPGEPSYAETEIDRHLLRSEFTATERSRIRTLLSINPRAGVKGLPGAINDD